MNDLTTEKTMTIREVSEALAVSRDAIERKVNELFPGLSQNGKTTHLNEYHVTAIKKELLNRNPNLRSAAEVVTELEMELLSRKVDQWKDEKIKRLTEQNAILAPKAIEYDKFMNGSNGQPIGDVAKVIGRKPNELHRLLREAKIMRDNHSPFAEYSHYFTVKEKPIANGRNVFVSYVLPCGFDYIQKRFGIMKAVDPLKLVKTA